MKAAGRYRQEGKNYEVLVRRLASAWDGPGHRLGLLRSARVPNASALGLGGADLEADFDLFLAPVPAPVPQPEPSRDRARAEARAEPSVRGDPPSRDSGSGCAEGLAKEGRR